MERLLLQTNKQTRKQQKADKQRAKKKGGGGGGGVEGFTHRLKAVRCHQCVSRQRLCHGHTSAAAPEPEKQENGTQASVETCNGGQCFHQG